MSIFGTTPVHFPGGTPRIVLTAPGLSAAEIMAASDKGGERVQAMLAALEQEGLLRRHGGGYWVG